MKNFNCELCAKKVYKKGEDWSWLDLNDKNTNLMSYDLNKLLRLCISCFKIRSNNGSK